MSETPENRIKRLKMRSMRRGIKEMDLILSAYAGDRLDGMSEAQIVKYDALLSENDQDLYQWVTGQCAPPAEFSSLISDISDHAGTK
ncbi:succinate dehydrogenase assembly factor 2 [Cognatishimia sp. MH4019]|uniref:succinate dehydrogenase assembly factor 2 n=1 Tax=Cognatishimia sp. MH4019 TaxID=2854030 RepID=UPI001CD47510|nr:succinate dehydrogenase assembly factor 2 [Cognatishimia sp. MH4019]